MTQCLNPECLHPNPQDTKFCQRCGSKLLLTERYRTLKIIGQGGFGRTFLGVDEFKPSKPRCVIKQFLPQAQGTNNLEKAAELFQQEAVRLDDLGQHPQIPELLAYFIQDNRQYLIQEYIEGDNLSTELAEKGAFSETQIKQVLADLLPVLQFIHKGQVIHRDIKPENIIRRRRDNKLILVDFGAAKFAAGTALAATGTVIGSAGYVAPEQAVGKANFASDIYSLGVTCLHLLTQVEPFELFDTSEGDWVWRDYLKAAINQDLAQVLDKMIVTATKRRYQSVEEILEGLNLSQQQAIPSPSPAPQAIQLISAKGVDYSRLEKLLADEKWREADEETAKRMLEAAGTERAFLGEKDIDNFPCEDLRIIDQLWVKYSNGRFGFSVQKRIYQSVGGTRNYDETIWELFGYCVGWRRFGLLQYDELTFSTLAQQGHLPVCGVVLRLGRGRAGWRSGVNCLLSRVEKCVTSKGFQRIKRF